MAAVKYQTIFESQNRNWPISQTSRTWGYRKQNRLVPSQLRWKSQKSTKISIPYDQRSIQDQTSDNGSQDQTRDEAKQGIRPGKVHHGQADVLGKEQGSSLNINFRRQTSQNLYSTALIYLLPTTSPVLDGITGLELNLPPDSLGIGIGMENRVDLVLQVMFHRAERQGIVWLSSKRDGMARFVDVAVVVRRDQDKVIVDIICSRHLTERTIRWRRVKVGRKENGIL